MTPPTTNDSPPITESGMFIRIEVDEPVASDAAAAKQLAQVCPVDIFAERDGRVAIIEDNVDECILCGLCLEVGPPGTVRVWKLYEDPPALLGK